MAGVGLAMAFAPELVTWAAPGLQDPEAMAAAVRMTRIILPEILNHVVATGFLSVTFIPLYTRRLIQRGQAEADRVFSILLCVFGSLVLAGAGFAAAFAPELVTWAAPGLEDPEAQALAARMTRIILPAQIFFFAGGLLTAVQFARERFLVPALAPLIYNLGIIAGGLLLGPWLGVEGFA
jgi:putative peptidoglycan lipid II flippase